MLCLNAVSFWNPEHLEHHDAIVLEQKTSTFGVFFNGIGILTYPYASSIDHTLQMIIGYVIQDVVNISRIYREIHRKLQLSFVLLRY